jgi:hypothetical protein
VNLSQINTFQQWLLFMHILCGGTAFVSIFVVLVRKRAFEKRFGAIIKSQREQIQMPMISFRETLRGPPLETDKMAAIGLRPVQQEQQLNNCPAADDLAIQTIPEDTRSGYMEPKIDGESALESQNEPKEEVLSSPTWGGSDHLTFSPGTSFISSELASRRTHNPGVFNFTGVGTSTMTTSFRRPGQSPVYEKRSAISERHQATIDGPALPWRSFLTREVTGRNAQFYGLTYEERESLGGVEYRAIKFLSWIVPIYVVLWQFLGCLSLGAWMAYNAADLTEANGINPWCAPSPRATARGTC